MEELTDLHTGEHPAGPPRGQEERTSGTLPPRLWGLGYSWATWMRLAISSLKVKPSLAGGSWGWGAAWAYPPWEQSIEGRVGAAGPSLGKSPVPFPQTLLRLSPKDWGCPRFSRELWGWSGLLRCPAALGLRLGVTWDPLSRDLHLSSWLAQDS